MLYKDAILISVFLLLLNYFRFYNFILSVQYLFVQVAFVSLI